MPRFVDGFVEYSRIAESKGLLVSFCPDAMCDFRCITLGHDNASRRLADDEDEAFVRYAVRKCEPSLCALHCGPRTHYLQYEVLPNVRVS